MASGAMSLYRRVTRYRASLRLDPRENRLTEITAATLERVGGLAQVASLRSAVKDAQIRLRFARVALIGSAATSVPKSSRGRSDPTPELLR